VKYELGFYIPEDRILHSHRPENLKPQVLLNKFCLLIARFLVLELPRAEHPSHSDSCPNWELAVSEDVVCGGQEACPGATFIVPKNLCLFKQRSQ
jgi:hypothetical protein